MRLVSLLAALLAAALLAGCGGSPADDVAIPGETPQPDPAASPDPTPAEEPSPRMAPVPERDREAQAGPLQPRPFTDPAELAEQLVAAETAIRSPDTAERDLVAWSWTQQQAYRDLVVNPGWRDQIREALPEELRAAFDRNVRAGAALRELTSPRDSLPEWRIIDPPPAEELLGHYKAAEEEFGVGWEYLAAIHLVETRMGRIEGVSVAGARGPMQFMPATWAAYGEGDIDDPLDSIRAAARYLTASGAPGDMRRALFAYNRSDRYVNAIIAHAEVMAEDERAYVGYYHWQVYYRLEDGDVILPVGWER
jgi:hypothetical protein